MPSRSSSSSSSSQAGYDTLANAARAVAVVNATCVQPLTTAELQLCGLLELHELLPLADYPWEHNTWLLVLQRWGCSVSSVQARQQQRQDACCQLHLVSDHKPTCGVLACACCTVWVSIACSPVAFCM